MAVSCTMNKADVKLKRPTTSFDYAVKREAGISEFRTGHSSVNKYESIRSMHTKEKPISDTEVRNESESDTDSDSDKKKSGKKSHDKSSCSKKLDKSQKSRKSGKGGSGQIDDCSLYDNNANSDDNSNDSAHNFATIKSESYQKVNIKTEPMSGNDNTLQRDDADGQATNNPNLDKSSSSVEEFDNEKPTKVVKVNINLDYDSEVYNEEVNVRRFHKYNRSVEMPNNMQAPFDTTTETFAYESSAGPILDGGQQLNYSSSDSDSDDSDGNDLDDSDNSSCDECAVGPCSASVLPSLQNGSAASSPAMSMSSYYTKNGKSKTILVEMNEL